MPKSQISGPFLTIENIFFAKKKFSHFRYIKNHWKNTGTFAFETFCNFQPYLTNTLFPNVAQGPVVLRHPWATLRIINPGLLLRICHFKVQVLQISKLFDYLACWAKFTFVIERKFLVYILMIKTRVFAEIKYIYTLGNSLEGFLTIYVAVTCLSVLHWFEFEAAEDLLAPPWLT